MSNNVIVIVNSSAGKVVKPLGNKARYYRVGSTSDYKEFETIAEAYKYAKSIHKNMLARYMSIWRSGVENFEASVEFTQWRDKSIIDSNFFRAG